jgi:hypothetical protein
VHLAALLTDRLADGEGAVAATDWNTYWAWLESEKIASVERPLTDTRPRSWHGPAVADGPPADGWR